MPARSAWTPPDPGELSVVEFYEAGVVATEDEPLADGVWAQRLDGVLTRPRLRALAVLGLAALAVATFGSTRVASRVPTSVSAPSARAAVLAGPGPAVEAPPAPPLAPGRHCQTQQVWVQVPNNGGVRSIDQRRCFTVPQPEQAPAPTAGPPYNHDPVDNLAQCLPTLDCVTQQTAPAGALAAIRQRLSGSTVTGQVTVLEAATGRLHFREIQTSYRGGQLLVSITRPPTVAASTRTTMTVVGGTGQQLRMVTHPAGAGLQVRVEYVGGADHVPSYAALTAVALDPRLVALR